MAKLMTPTHKRMWSTKEPSIKTPSRDDLVYMAGLFDGEGSIFLGKGHVKRRQPQVSPHVSVSMCDPEGPMLFFDNFGGHLVRMEFKNGVCRPALSWRLKSAPSIRRFVELVGPFVRTKQPQIMLMEAFLETVVPAGTNTKLADGVQEKRFLLYEMMKEAKRLHGAFPTENVAAGVY